MKVNTKQKKIQGTYFKDIKEGEVFYGEDEPGLFLMRTDGDDVVAVNIETGTLYYYYELDSDNPQYHVINAEVILDTNGNT